jgi:hypothetical protein
MEIDDRRREQREGLAQQQAAHHGVAQRLTKLGAGAVPEHERQRPEEPPIVVIMMGRKRNRQAWRIDCSGDKFSSRSAWIARRLDSQLIMLLSLAMIAESMREMTGWTPDIGAWSLTLTTLLQGAGLGFVFIPLQVIAFATLPADLRTDGTALFSLVRNVGISITSALLAQNTQIVHAHLAEYVTPFNRLLQTDGAYLLWNSATPAGLAALNAEITLQASIIAYIDDFKFMLLICLPAAALLLLMRRPSPWRPQPTILSSVRR